MCHHNYFRFQHGIYGGFILVNIRKKFMEPIIANVVPRKLYSLRIKPRMLNQNNDNCENNKKNKSNLIDKAIKKMPHLTTESLNKPTNPSEAVIFNKTSDRTHRFLEVIIFIQYI